MNHVKLSTQSVDKIADFVAEASEELDKLSKMTERLSEVTPVWVDNAIRLGIVHPSHRDSLINDISNGDVEKLASFIDKLSENVRPTTYIGEVAVGNTNSEDRKQAAYETFVSKILS